MNLKKLIARNTLVQILGKGISLILSLLGTAILTRSLGSAGYGDYIFLTSVIFLFAALADWGTNIITVREAAKDKKNQAKLLGSVLVLRFGLAVLIFLLFHLIIFFWPSLRVLASAGRIASLLLFFLSLKTSAQMVFQLKFRWEKSALVEIVNSFVFTAGILLLSKFSFNLDFVLAIFVFATALAAILSLFLASQLADFQLNFDRKIIKKVVVESLPMGGFLIIFSIYNHLDALLLQMIKGSAATGIYGFAYKIHDNAVLPAAFLMNSLFPVLSKRISRKKWQRIFLQTKRFLFIFALGYFFLMLFFSPLLVKIIAGPKFYQSILALRIVSLATVIAYFNHLTGYSLIALGRQRVSLRIAFLALGVNLGLNIIFIPFFSYLAAAAITVFTEGLVLFLSFRALKKGWS